ncbi:NUDIX domain-containing protein, partial [Mycobacterium sp. 20091114027_K0903767]|nr:NUDIX domain-containing protein [Mycobacterium sp. 20091114027_K0903767]
MRSTRDGLFPDAAPAWLKPLVDNLDQVPDAYRRRVPSDVLAGIVAANDQAARAGALRDAAVLVLFSGPAEGAPPLLPEDADLLVTVRASTLRHHAGQAAFPGGATDPGDDGPVGTAFREAWEETGIDTSRLYPLATLEKMFIPPSGFHVVPVLAYSPDPGPVAVVNESETAVVAR